MKSFLEWFKAGTKVKRWIFLISSSFKKLFEITSYGALLLKTYPYCSFSLYNLRPLIIQQISKN